MKVLNQIDESDVTRLNGEQLPQLLKILLCAEAAKRKIEKSGINVPFRVNVSDDGIDGEWNAEVPPNDFIPAAICRYQCKAEKISPSKCKSEMLIRGTKKLKREVESAFDDGGAFVFFCSHGFNRKLIKTRIQAARSALEEAGRKNWKTEKIFFLDAGQIARWVNQHAAAYAFICNCTKIGLDAAVQTFDQWSRDVEFRNQYQKNDQLESAILSLRKVLATPRSITRITGLSGLGKTRLALEVFREPDAGDSFGENLAGSMVYLDIQRHGSSVISMVDQFSMWGFGGIVVIDNCSWENHRLLVKSVSQQESQLSLMSLDYEPDQFSDDDYLHVKLLPEMMTDVVPKILKADRELAERLTEAGIERVSKFAQGFPQIAILTARAGQALGIDSLRKKGVLVDKLLWGREEENKDAREVIRCLSPFTQIGCGGRHEAQIDFILSEFCGINEYQYRRLTKLFLKNRVLQEIGDFVMVAPPPLAVALAADWLEDISPKHLVSLLPKIQEVGLTSSFCNRLRQLDFSPRAREISEKLTGIRGPFSSAKDLNSEVGSQVFRALSELNPLCAIRCLNRVFRGWSSAEFSGFNLGRRNLVYALEGLVWEEEHFFEAARILRGLAAGETESWANNATGQFNQLFHIFLPGTECPLAERLEVLRDGVASNDTEIRKVSINALGAALLNDRFSRSGGSEQRGSQPPKNDYNPRKFSEVWSYWKEAFLIIKERIFNDAELSEFALEKLGSNISAIITSPLIEDLDEDFRQIATKIEGLWPEARESMKNVLEYHEEVTSSHKILIREWLAEITPKDLKNRLKNVVSVPGWHHEEDETGELKDVSQEEAIELARELSIGKVNWLEHADVLLQGDQQQGWVFGKICAELSDDATDLMNSCLSKYRDFPESSRNPQLLRGILFALKGTNAASKILDAIAEDDDLFFDTLLPLTTAAATTVEDFERVIDLVVVGKLPISSIEAFRPVSQEFEISKFQESLEGALARLPDAAPEILNLSYSFISHHKAKDRNFNGLLRKLVTMPQVVEKLGDHQVAYSWNKLVDSMLVSPSAKFVQKLTTSIVDAVGKRTALDVTNRVPQVAFSKLLRTYSEIAWPIIEKSIRDENGDPVFALVDVLARSGRYGESGVPLWELDETEFRTWMENNEDLIPYFLHYLQLYRVVSESEAGNKGQPENESNEESYSWHPIARALLSVGRKMDIYGSLHANLFSFGSTGSRVPYFKRRLELVKQLRDESEETELRDIADSLIEDLKESISREEKRDVQHSAGIYAM